MNEILASADRIRPSDTVKIKYTRKMQDAAPQRLFAVAIFGCASANVFEAGDGQLGVEVGRIEQFVGRRLEEVGQCWLWLIDVEAMPPERKISRFSFRAVHQAEVQLALLEVETKDRHRPAFHR